MNESSEHKSILIGKLILDRNDIFLCDKNSQIIILCDTIENFQNDDLIVFKNWDIFGEILDDKPIVIAKSIIQVQKNIKGFVP